jgi:hypothetical protein
VRLRREEIDYIAWRIVRKLKESGEVIFSGSEEDLVERIRAAVVGDLQVEDDLNREVDEILKAHQSEILKESVDYRRMFQLIKNKLARERGLIL